MGISSWTLKVNNEIIVRWNGDAEDDDLPSIAHRYGVCKSDYEIARNNDGVTRWDCSGKVELIENLDK